MNQNNLLDYKEFIVMLYPIQQTDQDFQQEVSEQQSISNIRTNQQNSGQKSKQQNQDRYNYYYVTKIK